MSTDTTTGPAGRDGGGGTPAGAEPEAGGANTTAIAAAEPDGSAAAVETIGPEPGEPAEPTTTEPATAERGSVIATEHGLITEADADPWHRFATGEVHGTPAGAPAPTRLTRVLARTRIAVRHEWTLAIVMSLLAAVGMTWPLLADPAGTLPHDGAGPLAGAYLIGWAGHALLTDPSSLFTLNAFAGEDLSYAFGDTLLGFAPAGMIGSGPEATVLRFNILYVLSIALVVFGGYVLLRQLGARVPGAALGAAAIAFAPWRLAQAGHLDVVAVGGILLSLAMLARGHGWSLRDGYRRERTRWGWAAAGWGTAVWQLTLGFGMGAPFGYLLAAIAVVTALAWTFTGRKPIPWRVLLADGVGVSVFLAAAVLLWLPYSRVLDRYPYASAAPDAIDASSPPWLGLITAPAESWLWGGLHAPARNTMYDPGDTTLLMGFALFGLGLAGFLYSSWTRRQRWFLAGGLAVAVVLTMGGNFLDDGAWGFVALHEYLPGFSAVRVSGRLVFYVTLVLALLAAGTVTRLGDRLHEMAEERRVDPRLPVHRPLPMRLALFLPVVLVLLEGVSVAPKAQVPPSPIPLAATPAPILILPSSTVGDARAMLWSSDGYPEIVNGTAAFEPGVQERILEAAVGFPRANAVSALRQLGVATVVVRSADIAGTSWQHVLDFPPADQSVIIREDGGLVYFILS